jgi:hypothetical protein
LIDGNQIAALDTMVQLLRQRHIDISVTTLLNDIKEAVDNNGSFPDA